MSTGDLSEQTSCSGMPTPSYYRARYYDPNAGRFLSEDPIRWDGGSPEFYTYVLNDPIMYGDPTGRDIGVTGGYSGSFVGAANYLSLAPGMAAILGRLRRSEQYVEIRINNNCETGFDADHLIINWDPNCAFKCSKSGCTISPALALGHELAHADHRLSDNGAREKRRAISDPDFTNAEEQLVIQGPENNAAIALGECLRRSHHGPGIHVPTPFSH